VTVDTLRERSGLSEGGRTTPALAAWMLVLLALAAPATLAGAANGGARAYVVKVSGMINEAYAEAAKRKINTAVERGAEMVILELDTPGGTVSASTNLGDFIFTREDIRIVAFINTEAWSGGTLVALACDAIYMQSRLGKMGDVAPINQQGKMMPEKFQAPLRETMGNYAKARKYPVPLVDAMVTEQIEVYRIRRGPESTAEYVTADQWNSMDNAEREKVTDKELVVPAGQLATFSADEAVEHGLARAAVSSRADLYEKLDLKNSEVQWLYLSASERALSYLDMFSPLLISLGLILLFIELTNPGFGLPGTVGAGCFVLFFIVKSSLHYAGLFEILLFTAGLTLLAVELLLIPGFGWFGGIGTLLMVAGLVLSLQQFTIPQSPAETDLFFSNLGQIVGALAAATVGIAVLVRFLPSMPYFNRLVNRENLQEASVGSEADRKDPDRQKLVGRTGVTLTTLRPSGRADFDGKLLDVVAEGAFIEKGREVQVVAVHGNRIVVAPREEVQP